MPSSLSNLSIPSNSNPSLTILTCSTPKRVVKPKPNRQSNAMPRQSGHLTPSAILRQKQSANINMAGRELGLRKDSLTSHFQPTNFSTPMQPDRTKQSRFLVKTPPSRPEAELVATFYAKAAKGKQDVQKENTKTSTPIDKSDRRIIAANGDLESPESPTLIPETQEDDTLIPETQDDQVPNTQDDNIPETQENEMSASQNDVAADPVQAPVSLNSKSVNIVGGF